MFPSLRHCPACWRRHRALQHLLAGTLGFCKVLWPGPPRPRADPPFGTMPRPAPDRPFSELRLSVPAFPRTPFCGGQGLQFCFHGERRCSTVRHCCIAASCLTAAAYASACSLASFFLLLADNGVEKGGEGNALKLVHILLLGSADTAQQPLCFLQLGKLGVELITLGAELPFAQEFFRAGRKVGHRKASWGKLLSVYISHHTTFEAGEKGRCKICQRRNVSGDCIFKPERQTIPTMEHINFILWEVFVVKETWMRRMPALLAGLVLTPFFGAARLCCRCGERREYGRTDCYADCGKPVVCHLSECADAGAAERYRPRRRRTAL